MNRSHHGNRPPRCRGAHRWTVAAFALAALSTGSRALAQATTPNPAPAPSTPTLPKAAGTRVPVSNGMPNETLIGARSGGRRGGGWGGPPNQGVAGDPGGMRRQALVQQLQQRFEQIVRRRLQLTDEQTARLRQTNQRFGAQRRTLNERERAVREAMRQELQPGIAANQEHLGSLVDSLMALQRERLDILQAEQRDEAAYLTPLQRVQYYGLQEQLRRRLEEIRRRRQQMQQGAVLGRDPSSAAPTTQAAPADTLSP